MSLSERDWDTSIDLETKTRRGRQLRNRGVKSGKTQDKSKNEVRDTRPS